MITPATKHRITKYSDNPCVPQEAEVYDMRSLATDDLKMTSLRLVQQPSTLDAYSLRHALMSDVITLLRTALAGPDSPHTDSDIVKTLVKSVHSKI